MIKSIPIQADGDFDRAAAQNLTDRIRSTVENLSGLLAEAHERRAWKALGYRSWEAYVRAEFAMARSRSYQLLDQARVIAAVREAAGRVSTSVDISEAAARDIRADLPAVATEIRARIEGGELPEAAVATVISEKRAEVEARKAEKATTQAVHDDFRAKARAALPEAVQQIEVVKAEAVSRRRKGDDEPGSAEFAELREELVAAKAEITWRRAEIERFADMQVQWQQGGFEAVVAGKDEEIRVLKTRVERESDDKVKWMRTAEFWKKEAIARGYSRNTTIDIETGEIIDG